MTDCITFPSAMDTLLEMASVFSMDLFSETKMPCAFDIDYFRKIQIAIAAPLVVSGALAFGGIARAATRRKRKRRKTLAQMRMEQRRGSHNSAVRTGLWESAAAILLVVDLIWPSVTRILFQFFSCRDLGDAGKYLEVDYSIRPSIVSPHTHKALNTLHVNSYGMGSHCRSVLCKPMTGCDDNEDYDAYVVPTGVMAFAFAFGVPLLFWWLVHHFKDHGKAGDKVVHAALAWAYEPYRVGSEWWLIAEMPVQVLRNT